MCTPLFTPWIRPCLMYDNDNDSLSIIILYSRYDDPEDDPRLFPYWAASVVGPVLFLLAILHALLWKWPNAATGSVVKVILIFF